MKITEFEKGGVTQQQLDALESVLDKVFAKLGIDVEFTRHFLDRVNDERNIRPISIKELGMLFKKEFIKWGKPIAQMGPDAQAVMKDLETDINIPFVLQWNDRKGELELIAKTVMRKKDFKTSNKEFPVEQQSIGSQINFPGMKGRTVTPTATQAPKPQPKTTVKPRNRFDKIVNWAKRLFDEDLNEERGNPFNGLPEYTINNYIKKLTDRLKEINKSIQVQPKVDIEEFRDELYKISYKMKQLKNAKPLSSVKMNEDFGSIPPLTELIVMAVVAQTTVASLKAMFKVAMKTGKGLKSLRKLQKAALRGGEKTADFVLGEATREELLSQIRSRQEKEFYKAAIQALRHLVNTDGSKQSIGGYAFDIARAFNGVKAKELVDMYKAQYESIQEFEAKQSNPLIVLDMVSDRSDNNPFPVKFYDGNTINVKPKDAKRFMDKYYRMEPEQRDIVHKYIKTKKGFLQAIKNLNITEGWSEKYKKSIDCNNPKGFSQKAHCDGRKKK